MDLFSKQHQMLNEMAYPARNQHPSKGSYLAELSRLAGNDAFKRRMFKAALDLYNESLRLSPTGSKGIALAYGNRSAVYCEMGKYALAIENIKLARENGFPTKKISQLEAREKKCEKLMEEFGPDKTAIAESIEFFKLSHPPNEKIPFIAGCLELRKNVKYGRHIVTTKDLKTGDIIAIEPNAISFVNEKLPGVSCLFCTKTKDGSLIPCDHCTTAMYCSVECKQKAASYHLNVNALSEISNAIFGNIFKMILEAFRVAGGVDEALELLKDSEDKTIFDFDFSNPEDPNYEKNMLIAINGLCRHVPAPRMSLDFFMAVPPINEKSWTTVQRNRLSKFFLTQFKIYGSNMALFPTAHHGINAFRQLLNHSCIPDVDTFKVGDNLVMMVNHPIKAGQQIFDYYSVFAADHPKNQRDMFLLGHPFKCECKACVRKIPTPFPRKDKRFVEPDFTKVPPAEAIEQFKKNCKYVDENAGLIPCHEIAKLHKHNLALFGYISGQ